MELLLKQEKEISAIDYEKIVAKVLCQMGVPAHIKGYLYLKKAIMLGLTDSSILQAITKELYPEIALACDATPSRVERSIRHAVEVTFNHGNIWEIERIFGYTIHDEKGKPTNSEFISLVADYIRLRYN